MNLTRNKSNNMNIFSLSILAFLAIAQLSCCSARSEICNKPKLEMHGDILSDSKWNINKKSKSSLVISYNSKDLYYITIAGSTIGVYTSESQRSLFDTYEMPIFSSVLHINHPVVNSYRSEIDATYFAGADTQMLWKITLSMKTDASNMLYIVDYDFLPGATAKNQPNTFFEIKSK